MNESPPGLGNMLVASGCIAKLKHQISQQIKQNSFKKKIRASGEKTTQGNKVTQVYNGCGMKSGRAYQATLGEVRRQLNINCGLSDVTDDTFKNQFPQN